MAEQWILQFCHSHYGPFLDVARQYASLFKKGPYKVLTVFLTGKASAAAINGAASDEVIFLNFSSREIRGLKIGAIGALRKIIASRQIALIIAHRFKPIYIACLASKLPVIGVHHAFGDYDRPQRRWFVQFFKKRLALLAVSNAVRDDIRKHFPDWPTEQIETLYNRLDIKAVVSTNLPRASAREALGLPQNVPVIGNVGRLHPDKDQETLLTGFAIALPDLPRGSMLVVIGKGPLEAKLETLAKTLGISESVRFLGQVPNARTLFSAFDLFALSSDHEPFGMVLLEAMAADVPVIATNCGGAPEIVVRKDLLFDLRNPNQLADLLTSFFSGNNTHFCNEIIDGQKSRLSEIFSDEVARQNFFALPMIQAALGQNPSV